MKSDDLVRMRPIELAVFDLDDTLFPEWDFVRSGMRHLADFTSKGSSASADEIFAFLWDIASRREGKSFDRLLLAFPEIGASWSVEELVSAYRRHVPDIRLFAGIRELLEELRHGGTRIAIVTDGPPDAQRGKLKALQVMELVEEAVVTDEHGVECRKPSTFAFSRLNRSFGIEAGSCIYIGDNPAKDFAPCRALGWQTLRLRMAGQLHEREEAPSLEFRADAEVTCVAALVEHLRVRSGVQRIRISH